MPFKSVKIQYCSRGAKFLGLAFAELVLATACAFATNSPPRLQISLSGPIGHQTPELSWAAQPGAVYTIQCRTNLGPETPWVAVEPVTTSSNLARWKAPELNSHSDSGRFYQLLAPEPAIFRVEPTVGPSSGGTTVYIVGQCLGTNGQARIGGLVIAANVLQPGSTYSFTLPPLPEGTYDVDWIEGGQVAATAYKLFSVTAEVQPVGISQRLLEPPVEPPASPTITFSGGGRGLKIAIDNVCKPEMAARDDCDDNDTNPSFTGKLVGGLAHGDEDRLMGAAEDTMGSTVPALMKAKEKANQVKSPIPLSPTLTPALMKAKEKSNQVKSPIPLSPTLTPALMKAKEKSNQVKSPIPLSPILAPALMKAKEKANQVKSPIPLSPTFTPALMKAKEKGNRTKCSSNLRIAPNGELQFSEVDMFIPGRGLDFIVERTYCSRSTVRAGMTYNWTLSYDVSVSQRSDGGMEVFDGTGRSDVYYAGADGIYTRDEFFNEGSFDNGVFTLTFADTGRWEFNPLDATSPSGGKLSRIVDRNGNYMSLAYDGAGRLSEIVDDLGRTNRLSYNSVGLLQNVTDFSGRVVRYEYDANGDLTASVSPEVVGTPNGNDFPGGKTNHYAYSSGFTDERLNHNLTSMTDAKGQTWLQVVYAAPTDPTASNFDTIDFLQRGPYRIKHRRFAQRPTPQNSFAVVKCIENDAVGNVTECFYDSQNRCVRQLEYTGRANPDQPTTETQNRPVNKLRVEDPDYYETRCEWNRDSLCTLVTYPEGNSTEMIYERTFFMLSTHSHRRAADLRVLRERAACCLDRDDDGDGVPDATERTWRFAHDGRFGSGLAASRVSYDKTRITPVDGTGIGSAGRLRLNQSTIERTLERLRGLPGPMAPPMPNIPMPLEYGFVTAATDPGGNVTGATYDNQGNRTKKYRRVLLQQGRLLNDSDMPVEDYEYNTHGQCTAIINAADANGYRRRDTGEYYESGPQAGYLHTWTVDAQGPTFIRCAYQYDARGNVTQEIDPRGFTTDCIYNALDEPIRMDCDIQLSPRLRVGSVAYYDANDNVVRCDIENRDENGVLGKNPTWRTQFQYDILNRPTACWRDKNGNLVLRCTEASYDGNDNMALYRSGEAVNGNDPHNTVQFLYDERDLPYRTIYGPGSSQPYSEQYNYTRNGWKYLDIQGLDAPTAEIAHTRYEYDGFERCVETIDPVFNVERAGYDVNDNLLVARFDETFDVGSASTRRLSETRWVYDGLYRPVERRMSFFDVFTQLPIGNGASVSSRNYAPNGQVLSETDDNGHATQYTYDTVGRLSSVIDPKSNSVVYAYDSSGNLVSMTAHDRSDVTPDEQIFVTSFAYDGINRCIAVRDNVGNTQTVAYDSRGNMVSSVDPRGNETVCVYDGLSRCVETRCYAGTARSFTFRKITWDYSDNSRCTSSTDGNGNVTTYGYDSIDRPVTTTNADGTTERLIWSPRSNVSSWMDANGTVVTFTYDLLDRCVRKDIALNSASMVAGTTTFEEFTYDGLSRLVRGTNDSSMVEFTYDSLGNLIGANADGLATAATFDGMGNRLSLSYAGGRAVQCTYDGLDRLATIGSAPPGSAMLVHASYAYEGVDRLTKITRINGVNTRISWNGLQNPPNSAGDFGFRQVSRINHARAGTGSVVAQRSYTYDANQNKISSVAAPFVPGGSVISSALRYDGLDQLSNSVKMVGGSVSQATDYSLDPMGNRAIVMHLGGGVDNYIMDATLPEPGDSQMNQYSMTPFGGDHYDRNGNLVERDTAAGPTYFRYDYADRLVEVSGLDSTGILSPLASFSYDVFGRRISKTTYPPAPAAPVKTQFIYGPNPDEDCDGIIEFRRDGVVVGTFVLPEVNDEVLVAFTGTGAAAYFHSDELRNVLALTDAKGNVLEFYDYDDYGLPTFLNAQGAPLVGSDGQPVRQSPLGNPFLFHSLFWDAEIGSYHDSGAIKNTTSSFISSGLFRLGSGNGGDLDPHTGRYRERKGNPAPLQSAASTFAGNNPWSAGISVDQNTGRVKFFNNAKGFGFRSRARVNFFEAWPCRWEGPELDAMGIRTRPREFTGHVTLIK